MHNYKQYLIKIMICLEITLRILRIQWGPCCHANHCVMSGMALTTAGASPGLRGGGPRIFFSDLGICMSRSDMLRMAKPCALLGGFGGMLPRENFLKRCNLVRFKVYFDQILSLFFSKNAIFYIKNKYFRYTFVMG